MRSEDEVISHYHIKTVWSERDPSFYITPGVRFPTLAKLVHHYRNIKGVCCILTYPYCTAERLFASGKYSLSDTKKVRAEDAQGTSSDARLSSSLRASQKQAARQHPHNTKEVRAGDGQKPSGDTKLSSSLTASQKQAEGNRQNHVSPTIYISCCFFNMCEKIMWLTEKIMFSFSPF